VLGRIALGIRLHKPTAKDRPCVEWAVVTGEPARLVDGGSVRPPRTYSEEKALAHLHEAIGRIVRENRAKVAFVWAVETIARGGNALRPRIRAEGAVCAAASLGGAEVSLVTWHTIQASAEANRSKDDYKKATDVCGIDVGDVDPQAVLAAMAALRS
jgi:hypothetical protein